MFNFPENCKVVLAAAPQVGSGAAVDSTAISLKLVNKLWIVVQLAPSGGAAYTLTPQTDALVAFGSAAVLTNAVRIWANEAIATNDRLVEQTAAVNFATTANANSKLVIFEIDPANMTDGEDCVRVEIPALAVGDYASVLYVIEPRYPARPATALTVLTD